jgi:hypothetical protein
MRQLNAVDVNNVLRNVAYNVYKVIGRKGLTVLAGQPVKTSVISTEIPVPAGADVADVPNIKAMLSCYIGAMNQQAQGLSDLCVTGVL